MDLNGKIAMVTGGAVRVGRAIALGLARAGADIALHYYRSADDAVSAAAEIAAMGRCVEIFHADLAEPSEIERLFGEVASVFGRLDVLVNNAALYESTPIETLTAQQWDRQFAVNARAPALCIRHAIPLMPAGSAVINITDSYADHGRAKMIAYGASKGALQNLTRSAAIALAPRIRVNSVAPGVVAWAAGSTDGDRQKILSQVPMLREGSPEDVAAAVVFLVKNDYITGQNLRVDGGWIM